MLGRNVNTIFFTYCFESQQLIRIILKFEQRNLLSLSKHNEKMKIMRILFILRNFLLEMISKILLYTQKNTFFCEKVSFFWFDFTIVLSILQMSKVGNNLITILGYSNDENIYIAKNIISIDQLILFTRFGIFNQQDSTHSITLCFQKSLKN